MASHFDSGTRGILLRAADLCLEREEELARLMTLKMGKRIAEARKEVKLCASIFEYYAIRPHEFLQPQWLPSALLLLQPAAGALALVWLIAAWAVVFGILLMIVAFRMRNWNGVIAVQTDRV